MAINAVSFSDQIKSIKMGGDRDDRIDRKEEALAIIKFANSMTIKAMKPEHIKELALACEEAEVFMNTNPNISDEDRAIYQQEKENGVNKDMVKILRSLLKMAGAMSDFQKKINENDKKYQQQHQQLMQMINSIKMPTSKISVTY